MEIFFVCIVIFGVLAFVVMIDPTYGNKPHLPKAPAPLPAPQPESKPPEGKASKKDISEPVISFVNFLKSNPENFCLKKHTIKFERYGCTVPFTLFDMKNRKKYTYNVCTSVISCKEHFIPTSVSFLTDDEKEYLLEAHEWGQQYISAKMKKASEEKASIEREEYKKIYCEGV